ncbi:MAG: hypothetical protein KGH64_01860 [Candidatus Micrarchaeota archaeon]|nr:hypothetical protein [Candidatus Micrarchaeota archaeon]MDE1834062.1 hypothetical protein [Candidatus Micrarchaeota archaeon]MDE1859166.1 hypothetical protein [Candidatus Micrarchaeota archaeon]
MATDCLQTESGTLNGSQVHVVVPKFAISEDAVEVAEAHTLMPTEYNLATTGN